MKKPIRFILEGLLISAGIILVVILAIRADDRKNRTVNPLDKYDSITAKLPVQEKILDFNDKPKRVYYDKEGLLTKEF